MANFKFTRNKMHDIGACGMHFCIDNSTGIGKIEGCVNNLC